MNLQDCITFANENKRCYLATVEDDQPRVRPMGLWFADEKGFYFQSHAEKALGINSRHIRRSRPVFTMQRRGRVWGRF